MTFDEINQHIAQYKLGDTPKTREEAQLQICPIYQATRPLLQVIATIPWLPSSWTALIKVFVETMDILCPPTPPSPPVPPKGEKI
jgi:hypothetical protein